MPSPVLVSPAFRQQVGSEGGRRDVGMDGDGDDEDGAGAERPNGREIMAGMRSRGRNRHGAQLLTICC